MEKSALAQNVAKGKPATQSSTERDLVATKCFDGNYYGFGETAGLCSTQPETNPQITVDLGEVYHVLMIAVINREDCCQDRLVGSELRVGNSTDPLDNSSCGVVVDDGGFYDCDLWGRYVTLRRATSVQDYFNVAEIGVWAQRNICPRGVAS